MGLLILSTSLSTKRKIYQNYRKNQVVMIDQKNSSANSTLVIP